MKFFMHLFTCKPFEYLAKISIYNPDHWYTACTRCSNFHLNGIGFRILLSTNSKYYPYGDGTEDEL